MFRLEGLKEEYGFDFNGFVWNNVVKHKNNDVFKIFNK